MGRLLIYLLTIHTFSIMSRQSKGYGYVHHKATHRKRPGRHSKRPNKNSQIKRYRAQGK